MDRQVKNTFNTTKGNLTPPKYSDSTTARLIDASTEKAKYKWPKK